MQGVITRREVLAHPFTILDGFGTRVLIRALISSQDETFLDVVNRVAEEEAHRSLADVNLARTVEGFLRFEIRMRELYRELAALHSGLPDAATFFRTLAEHEEGHAVLLAQVRREVRRGRCWKRSPSAYREEMAAVEGLLSRCEAEVRGSPPLSRSLQLVEALEGSELNVVFDTLRTSVDMRSRARFERFFVLTQAHLHYFNDRIRVLRAAHGIALSD